MFLKYQQTIYKFELVHSQLLLSTYLLRITTNQSPVLTTAGSAEGWAARAALWAQQRHVEQHYAQQYQQQQQVDQQHPQQTFPPLPLDNAPPLPPENVTHAPHPPDSAAVPHPPGEPPTSDFHDSEPEGGENDQLYPPGEDPAPELRKEETSDNIEVAPMEEDDIGQSEHQNQHDHQGDSHHHGDQNNHAVHYGNHPQTEFHSQQKQHAGQFENYDHQVPQPYQGNHHHHQGHYQPPPPEPLGGFPPEPYPSDQHGQFSNFNHGAAAHQPFHPEEGNYQQYDYNNQQAYGHFDQYEQGRQQEYQQQPKPLLQTEIPISSLPSHVAQTESGEF